MLEMGTGGGQRICAALSLSLSALMTDVAVVFVFFVCVFFSERFIPTEL